MYGALEVSSEISRKSEQSLHMLKANLQDN